MPISTRLLLTLVEIWARRDEPQTADLRRVLHAAKVLQDNPSSPTHLRAFAWRLVADTHRAAGWNLPPDVSLASCRAAADSLSHASSLLRAEVAAEVSDAGEAVLLLGGLADSQSVFGRWDLVPAEGAVLVALERRQEVRLNPADLPITNGIHWGWAGSKHEIYQRNTMTANLDGTEVLVPRPELVAARVADHGVRPEDPAALVFCGAVFGGDPDEIRQLATDLGRTSELAETAAMLRLDGYLGLETGGLQKRIRNLRRKVGR